MNIRSLIIPALLAVSALAGGCGSHDRDKATEETPRYVTVRDGNFYIGDSLYRYIGANFWYGAILGSEGRGGDRARLARELDSLQAIGVDNLRILVGGDGPEGLASHIAPTLQTAPGVYNDTLLAGLDYLLDQLEQRDMKAVLYLNNAWEWSGGYATYLEWAGAGEAVNPATAGYPAYMDYASQFVRNDSAKALAADHVRAIVTRTNSLSGRPYAESPAIMSWQIANEPRAFADESKPQFAAWIKETAALIKSLDPNHLVSVGSEGSHGCENDLGLWADIHSTPDIDYGTIHIWPYNWSWITDSTVTRSLDSACIKTGGYIDRHLDALRHTGKPLVVEEFGYPRDGMETAPGSAVTARDGYYAYLFGRVAAGDIAGVNFWGWAGTAQPAHRTWEPGDDYTGDPAQEPQGLNSVFAADTSTVALIRAASARLASREGGRE